MTPLRRSGAALAVSAAVSLLAAACSGGGAAHEAPHPAEVTLPPVGAGFDYQLGEPYPPPAGVSAVTRDHTARPAPGIYNICYVNAFQAQPGAEWDTGLLLRDKAGKAVMDEQ